MLAAGVILMHEYSQCTLGPLFLTDACSPTGDAAFLGTAGRSGQRC